MPTRPKTPLIYNPKVRGIAYQVVLCALIVFLAWGAISNAADNLARAKIASGFGFWDNTAGFDISQTLIDYSTTSTYGRAFWVGLLNTLLVAALGIVFATILGFVIGIARLSKNWLVARHGRRLCRDHPQPAAAAATAVLVQRRAQGAAGDARQPRAFRAAASSTTAACSCRSRCSQPGCALGADRARRRHRRRDRLPHLGEAPADAHRPAGAGAVGHARRS